MWGPVCVCIQLCIVAFVCFAFVFNYLRLYMHLLECCRGNPQDYPPPTLSTLGAFQTSGCGWTPHIPK